MLANTAIDEQEFKQIIFTIVNNQKLNAYFGQIVAELSK